MNIGVTTHIASRTTSRLLVSYPPCHEVNSNEVTFPWLPKRIMLLTATLQIPQRWKYWPKFHEKMRLEPASFSTKHVALYHMILKYFRPKNIVTYSENITHSPPVELKYASLFNFFLLIGSHAFHLPHLWQKYLIFFLPVFFFFIDLVTPTLAFVLFYFPLDQ